MTIQVMSYGGGTNTAAMCVLVAMGKLPRPDFILMADTSREASPTWDYLTEVMQPYLLQHGLSVVIASHELATVDLYSGNGDVLMPMFTEGGALPTFCSMEWKERVIARYLRASGVDDCETWIGYTIDEIGRVKPGSRKWMRRVFPLVEGHFTRRDCYAIVASAGLPEPPKSACFMCPHRSNAEWRYLRDQYPDDFQQAISVEREVRATKDAGLFLHPDRVELALADLDKPDRRENRDMQCGLGMCFV
jgi:hypothetical protein